MSKKNKKAAARSADLAAARGLERERHFAEGGTVASWRGRSARFELKPKADSARKCRGRVRDYDE